MRYKAVIEYEGTAFVGWQRQTGISGKSVQEVIEAAIKSFSQQTVVVYAAGRTDSGVHALGQVIHFDLRVAVECYVVKNALNHYLRHEMVSIIHLEEVDEDFHCRFSARQRHYVYKISNREAPLCVDRMRMWHVPRKLNVANMRGAASYLVGKKDYTSFRAKDCQSKSPVKTIDRLEITEQGDVIHVEISALSFLHKQVRIIVGTIVQCGHGLFSPEYIETILEKRERSAAGITAPPYGLYLTHVEY